jgi:hypothetical protein
LLFGFCRFARPVLGVVAPGLFKAVNHLPNAIQFIVRTVGLIVVFAAAERFELLFQFVKAAVEGIEIRAVAPGPGQFDAMVKNPYARMSVRACIARLVAFLVGAFFIPFGVLAPLGDFFGLVDEMLGFLAHFVGGAFVTLRLEHFGLLA